EDLAPESGDPARREVDHPEDRGPDQLFGGVAAGELRARLADADRVAEVDPELDRGPLRLGERLGAHYRPGPDVEGLERIDRGFGLGGGHRGLTPGATSAPSPPRGPRDRRGTGPRRTRAHPPGS